MMESREQIRRIIKEIEIEEKGRRKVCQEIRKRIREKNFEEKWSLADKCIIKKMKPAELSNKSIAGVDGGIILRRIGEIDLAIVRVSCVVFRYGSSGKLESVIYYPSRNPSTRFHWWKSSSTREAQVRASLRRQLEELSVARDFLDVAGEDVDYLLMDGSLLPQEDGRSTEEYRELMNVLSETISLSKKRGVELVGVVEDSKSRSFTKMLSEMFPEFKDVLSSSFDVFLLNWLLKKGERTGSFYFREEMGVKGMYLKPVEDDLPLRVEFLGDPDQISSTIYSLSSVHKSYAYPSVLIEADKMAKLSEDEGKTIYYEVMRMGGERLIPRRERRPFQW
ncbi:MAG TPA: DNA double-strand break repair nuclease NurA [Euryarchaeota archaeon]|nr:DNA double-strand break repair nuclease NurA [Euryarchaeota archaeon]